MSPSRTACRPARCSTITGGSFAVTFTREGDLYESTDHGRTFRAAGRSPIPAPAVYGVGCSALGCSLHGPVVRLGWGPAALPPRASGTDAFSPP